MPSSTLTSKGQITLPKSVRERLHLGTGDRVEFVETPGGFELRALKRDIREIKGLVAHSGKPVTIEEMNREIAKMGRPRP